MMARVQYTLCLLFAAVVIMQYGCKKQDSIPAGVAVKITLPGGTESFIAISSAAQWDPSINSGTLGIIAHSATNGTNGDYLAITIPGFKNKTGKYDVSKDEAAILYDYYLGYAHMVYTAVSGTVTITSVGGNRIQGYYNCVLDSYGNKMTMTNGQFNVAIQ
jgi:hypothetical protein